jgi:hypothetical protein
MVRLLMAEVTNLSDRYSNFKLDAKNSKRGGHGTVLSNVPSFIFTSNPGHLPVLNSSLNWTFV